MPSNDTIIRGTAGNDNLRGTVGNDVFDANAGGDDILSGLDGDDVYWLGFDTGHDRIKEYVGNTATGDAADVIKLKAVRRVHSARLSRDDKDLRVERLDGRGQVTDSLVVDDYYANANAKVEKLQFSDGVELLDVDDIAGSFTEGSEYRFAYNGGMWRRNVFDIAGGKNESLYGRSGNDSYMLGAGTGHDRIKEYVGNSATGDTADVIKLKAAAGINSVRLSRKDEDLLVELLGAGGGATDSLTVDDYYARANAKVEKLQLSDGVELPDVDDIAGSFTAGSDYRFAYGGAAADTFGGTSGENDVLYGRGGNDVYAFGKGSGHDRINEHVGNTAKGDAADVIKLKVVAGINFMRLSRKDEDLLVELLGAGGGATDSLVVDDYYVRANAKVEKLQFSDGVELSDVDDIAGDFTAGNSRIVSYGGAAAGIFGGTSGENDVLYGLGGNDVYTFGKGSGHDRINEHVGNTAKGDAADVIKLKAAAGINSVRLLQNGEDLLVELLSAGGQATDSLVVEDYYVKANAKVEKLQLSDGVELLDVDDIAGDFTEGSDYRFAYGAAAADTFDIASVTYKWVYNWWYNGWYDGLYYSWGHLRIGTSESLYGRGGNDVYAFGKESGHDRINEHVGNTETGDAADVIKLKAAAGINSVRFLRNDEDLRVELLGAWGQTTDSLVVDDYYAKANAKVEKLQFSDGVELLDVDDIAGDFTEGSDYRFAYGGAAADTFVGTNGENDVLYGRGGNDVYTFGKGSGHDRIKEHVGNTATGDAADVIKLKAATGVNSVRLSRKDEDLLVELLGAEGQATDSLTVEDYYARANAKVEKLQFSDGVELLDVNDIAGNFTAGSDYRFAYGGAAADTFGGTKDADYVLYGRGGNDVYDFGKESGHDRIKEYVGNSATGDTADVIKLTAAVGVNSVRLSRNGKDFRVELLGAGGQATDSLTVDDYYAKANAKVEKLQLSDGVELSDASDIAGSFTAGSDYRFAYGDADANTFDGISGKNESLYGRGGNDVYTFDTGSGHDRINERVGNTAGDTADEINLKAGIGKSDVRLVRSYDRQDLLVELLNKSGDVTDSLTVEKYYRYRNAKVESVKFVVGKAWDEDHLDDAEITRPSLGESGLYGLQGSAGNDAFDGRYGGNHKLYGKGGHDVYWLGRRTDFDVIVESEGNTLVGDAGDVIRVRGGIGPDSVRLSRTDSGTDLNVELLDGDGNVSDGLQVKDYYTKANAKVERVEFADGTVWGVKEFLQAEIIGGSGDDNLYGGSGTDVFDGDAGGSDNLHGRGGDDVYLLGRGTGNDRIKEYEGNTALGDGGDVIRLKEGFAPSSLELSREGNNLVVSLGGSGQDSLTVENHFSSVAAKVEKIEAGGKVLLEKDYQRLIDALSGFSAGGSFFGSKTEIYDYYWDSGTTLSTSGGG